MWKKKGHNIFTIIQGIPPKKYMALSENSASKNPWFDLQFPHEQNRNPDCTSLAVAAEPEHSPGLDPGSKPV
jgi:hypothetical protein